MFHQDLVIYVASRIQLLTKFGEDRMTFWGQTDRPTEKFAHLRGTNILVKNVNARVFTNQCGQTDSGQRPILKPHLSNQCSITRKTAPPPWQPYIYKTNLFTKFHEDWAKNVTSKNCSPPPGSHVIQLTGKPTQLSYQGNRCSAKFHENLAKNVTSRKNASPTGGHVFSPIWTILELVREINKTNQKLKTAPPTGGHVFQRTGSTFELNKHIIKTSILTNFELNRDFIGTKLLTKFHEDRTINVASRVFTNKC
ncbi:hypothetical protein DPMN_031553 [Dreissena polymorpha]|uniref:Uncharacterized protein n=1 Tax=Dreissena polymorpha TaxID=45954 RepID=A0A9D4M4U4_DREPO|nr:hypothetical protein DPMN_031553 [Dreissena polymorpha]